MHKKHFTKSNTNHEKKKKTLSKLKVKLFKFGLKSSSHSASRSQMPHSKKMGDLMFLSSAAVFLGNLLHIHRLLLWCIQNKKTDNLLSKTIIVNQ